MPTVPAAACNNPIVLRESAGGVEVQVNVRAETSEKGTVPFSSTGIGKSGQSTTVTGQALSEGATGAASATEQSVVVSGALAKPVAPKPLSSFDKALGFVESNNTKRH